MIVLIQLQIVLLRSSILALRGSHRLDYGNGGKTGGFVTSICDRGGGEGKVLNWFSFF